jgi:hypothetical protein
MIRPIAGDTEIEMSRYGVDKLLREITHEEGAFQGFKENRAAFLGGRDLTEEEHRALMELDYRWLYANGAHFFLLNSFAMRTWPGDRATAQKTYLSSLADLGYPDFAT